VTKRLLAAAAAVVSAAVVARADTSSGSRPSLRTDRPVLGYADGAPPGFSGGFGELSCHACHFHEAVNSAPGRVALAGVPEQYAAGERYPLTVTLSRADMRTGGFQLTARFADGGAQAGVLQAGAGDEKRVKVERPGAIEYAGQGRAGAQTVADDGLRWTLVWTAPSTGGAVQFHVAANAGNNDETVEGDFVYTTSAKADPRH
jgi:hypothetical protein